MRVPFLFALLTLLVAGCGAAASPTHHHALSLSWGMVGVADAPTLDPALASDPASISLCSLVYGGLVRLDRRLRAQPDAAKSWTVSRDGRTYTFHLRPGLRFADGHGVSASDIAGALSRALGSSGPSGPAAQYLDLIAPHGVTVLGPHRLSIRLVHPAAHFLAELAFPVSYVPDPATIARYGLTWTDHADGFGPYRVSAWSEGRSLTLVPNRYYYGGTPVFRRITIHFYAGLKGALTAYRSGALDIVTGIPPGRALSGPRATRRVPSLALDYVAFNTTQAPFNKLAARQAFAAADVRSAARTSEGTGAFPTTNLLPPLLGILAPHWHGRAPHYTPSGPLNFVVLRDPQLSALATKLANAWSLRLGVDIRVRQLNLSDYTAVLNARAFDLALVRWGADYADPQDFLGTQLGASPDNVTGWAPARYDRLVSGADGLSPSDPRRMALFSQAARIAARQVPILPIDQPAMTAVMNPSLRGVYLTPLGTITGDWTRARLS